MEYEIRNTYMVTKRISSPEELPEGFVYQPDLISPAEESALISAFQNLNFVPFEYMGYTAKRRVVVYGWDYNFGTKKTSTAEPVPEFLFPLREKAAAFAVVPPEALFEAVLNEYPPGAPIGWHRDIPQFEVVVGISLGSACRMRLRPYKKEGKSVSLILEPRSAYILRDDARWKWQHSIPAVEALRYSVTFRTLRKAKDKPAADKRG